SQLGGGYDDDGTRAPPEPSPEPATTAELDPGSSRAMYEAPPAPDPFSQYEAPPAPDGEGTFRSESPFASPGQELSQSEPEPTPSEPMPMAMAPIPVSNPSISRPFSQEAFSQETVPRFSSDPSEP